MYVVVLNGQFTAHSEDSEITFWDSFPVTLCLSGLGTQQVVDHHVHSYRQCPSWIPKEDRMCFQHLRLPNMTTSVFLSYRIEEERGSQRIQVGNIHNLGSWKADCKMAND